MGKWFRQIDLRCTRCWPSRHDNQRERNGADINHVARGAKAQVDLVVAAGRGTDRES